MQLASDKNYDQLQQKYGSPDNYTWEEPILFDEVETPNIAADLLPGVFGDFARELSKMSETPEAMSVFAVLSVIAAAASKHYCVSPNKDWVEPINIYVMVGLPPANSKTLVLNQCLAPLIEWERQKAIELQPIIDQERSKRKTQEAIIEAKRREAAKKKHDEREACIADIQELEANLASIPTLPKLFVNDATPEALIDHLSEQGGYLGIFSDEGGIIDVISGLYTGGKSNIDVLLKGIDGGNIRKVRKDKYIDLNPFLTIFLAVQPAVIKNMGAQKVFSGKGFIERFLYILPKSYVGYRSNHLYSIDNRIKNAYYDAVRVLLEVDSPHNERTEISLSAHALDEWQRFRNDIETQLRPNGRLYSFQGWGGKLPGFLLRIAALIQIASVGLDSTKIDEQSMKNASTIGVLLIDHAIAAQNLMGADQGMHDAKELYQWFLSEQSDQWTRTDITRALRNRQIGKKERLNAAIGILIDRHIIREIKDDTTQKPTTRYQLNPKLKGKNTRG